MQPGRNIAETSSNLWKAALTTSTCPSKPKGKVKKSQIIHHPEFEEASKCIDDLFWVEIMHCCARKKFPRGFVYTDRILKHRNNNISILLPDDPQGIAQTSIYFFQENGKLYSKRDAETKRKIEEEKILDQLVTASSDWTCVARSKNRRATHIRDYIDRKYSHLTRAIRDELFTQINIGFETKFIMKTHVQFENSQILDIDGIDANETGVIYTRPISHKRLTVMARDAQLKDKSYRHYDNWLKYFEDYIKFVVASTKSSHTIQTSSYDSSKKKDSDANCVDT